jgi:hypothetical protein
VAPESSGSENNTFILTGISARMCKNNYGEMTPKGLREESVLLSFIFVFSLWTLFDDDRNHSKFKYTSF